MTELLIHQLPFPLCPRIVFISSCPGGEEEVKPGRSLQKVQGHRTAQGHRAGVDVDVTPSTGGPVGHPPQSGDPV